MIDLVLSPRDGLFLKDGREWASAAAGRAHSLDWPMPSTLFGALCTACGRLREAAGQTLGAREWRELAAAMTLGPSVALRRLLAPDPAAWAPAHRVWPVPADALFLAEEAGRMRQVVRLDPRPPRHAVLGRDDEQAAARLWWPRLEAQAKPAPAPLWWAEEAMLAWLGDAAAERPCEGAFRGLALPRHVQAHVGIDAALLTAREGILFAHDLVETLDGERCEWAIGCRLLPAGDLPTLATLGGDRRPAGVAVAGGDLFAFPEGLGAAFANERPRGLRLVAATPAAFAAGWRPDGFAAAADGVCRGRLPGLDDELILRAAFVPRPIHVSGWNMAERRPKPTTRLVPRGAVYHFVRTDGGAFSDKAAKKLWFVALGSRTAEGFGYFVPGLWHPKEEA
jgi:CRISPR-associated protein Cmr3